MVDLKCSFWQVFLDNENADLTPFNTPSNWNLWLQMAFSISSAPEEFQRRWRKAVECGLPGGISVYKDILVSGYCDTEDEVLANYQEYKSQISHST